VGATVKGIEAGDDRRRIPRHVAIIMDGNGRWAQRRSLPRFAGHKAGVEAVRKVGEFCIQRDLEVLTLFAFSSENWRRPQKEVGLLLDLFMLALNREVKRLKRNNVRLRILGDKTAFPDKLQARIEAAEKSTAEGSGLQLQVAANYGGRWDVTQAVRRLAVKVRAGQLTPEAITEEAIAAELSFAGLPDPDLFIRTGGEQRLSNFLLWQSAYAELYFTDTLWPEFGEQAFGQALASFASRQRRFGQTSEQARAADAGTPSG
jgi:undecaprenyl diphosphate synthase